MLLREQAFIKNRNHENMKFFTKIVLVVSLLVTASVNAGSVVGGVHHVGLSVLNLEESEEFFVKHLGFEVFKRDSEYPAVFLKNTEVVITLWRVKNPGEAIKFNRKGNVGLHHLALSVDSFESLQSIYKKMKSIKNVKIEFSPELLGAGPAKHMMMYEPSGNRIEFIHSPKKAVK